MVRSIFVLAGILASSSLLAEGLMLKPKLTQSQMTLDADTVGVSGDEDPVDGGKLTVPGKGAGVDLEFSLGDRARLGVGLSYAEFERFNTKAFDTALGAYVAFDLVKEDSFTLYGKSGVSLHQYGQETFKTASLVNGDVGVGVSLALAPNLDLGAEYQYSSTIVKGEMKAKDFEDFKVKGVSQVRNDYSLFVAMKI